MLLLVAMAAVAATAAVAVVVWLAAAVVEDPLFVFTLGLLLVNEAVLALVIASAFAALGVLSVAFALSVALTAVA